MVTVGSEFRKLKFNKFEDALSASMPINTSDGRQLGRLVPIGRWIESDHEKIEQISSWRNAASKMFPTRTWATHESTIFFLKKNSINNENGILFGIFDDSNRFIGHIGIIESPRGGVELAHLIRGVPEGDSKLVYWSELRLLEWCFSVLGANDIVVEVMSYNWIVMMMHQELGFKIEEKKCLQKVIMENGTRHVEVCREESNVPYSIVVLRLCKCDFYNNIDN